MKPAKKNNQKTDVFLLLRDFQKLIRQKPPLKTMVEEIMMMGLKIKPIVGDVSLLNLSNKKIVEVLWSLGKFDDFFQAHYKNLSEKEQSILLEYFDHFREKLVLSLPTTSVNKDQLKDFKMSVFEIEILRPSENQKKLN